jgi:hypothetical protein
MPQFGVCLTIVIYDHKTFIVQATGFEVSPKTLKTHVYFSGAKLTKEGFYNIVPRLECFKEEKQN